MLIIPSLGLVTMAGNAPLKQKKPPLGWPDCPASSRGGVFFLYSAGGEFESRGLPKQSFLHLRNVIFILRLQVFLMSFRCSFFSEKKRFIQQKSRTEVRDFCLHLVCQRNLVEVAGVEPASESTLTGLSPGADGYCGGLAPPVPLEDGKPSRRHLR